MREARAAGISDARIAAAISTSRGAGDRQHAGNTQLLEIAADKSRQRKASDRAGHGTGAGNDGAFAEDARQQMREAPSQSRGGCRIRGSER